MRGLLLVVPSLLLLAPALAQDKKVDNFTLTDTDGKQHMLYDHKEAKAVVLLFIGTECPLVNRYIPRLVDMEKKYGKQGVVFLAINSNAMESVETIAKHAKDSGISFPVLLDREEHVADALKIQITPTAVVVDASWQIRYRGLINDNKSEELAKNKYLRDALDAVLAGKRVPVAETEPVG